MRKADRSACPYCAAIRRGVQFELSRALIGSVGSGVMCCCCCCCWCEWCELWWVEVAYPELELECLSMKAMMGMDPSVAAQCMGYIPTASEDGICREALGSLEMYSMNRMSFPRLEAQCANV